MRTMLAPAAVELYPEPCRTVSTASSPGRDNGHDVRPWLRAYASQSDSLPACSTAAETGSVTPLL
jgi:hypothetical protein